MSVESRRRLGLMLGLATIAIYAPTSSAQIPRRGIPIKPATSQPAAGAGAIDEKGPPSARATEPFSPTAPAVVRRTSGFTGASPLTRATPTSDFLPIPDRWRVGVPAD